MNGFTMVEILIVTGIIALLATIVIPNFFRARENAVEKSCLANIRQLEGALEMAAAMDNTPITNLTANQIEAAVVPDYVKKMPECPYGTYSTDADGEVHCTTHLP